MTTSEPDRHSYNAPAPARAPWTQRAAAALFAILCLEVGIFLLIYPWTESWNWNLLVTAHPRLAPIMLTEQFRGAVSGLGVLNLFIGVFEAIRLRRFSGG